MSTATERITMLVTTDEKSEIAKKAKGAGLSMGELLRRAAATFNPSDDNAAIDEGVIEQMVNWPRISRLEDALTHVEQSNKLVTTTESRHNAIFQSIHLTL